MSRIRTSISLADDIKKYLDDEAEKCGMNVSSFVTMCLLEHRKQNESLATMADVIEQLTKVQKEK